MSSDPEPPPPPADCEATPDETPAAPAATEVAPAATEAARRHSPARWFLLLFGLLFTLNVVDGLARDALSLTVLGLLLAPVVGAGCLTLVASSLLDLRRGRWAQGSAGLTFMVVPLAVIGSGAIGRTMMFPGCVDPLPAPGTEMAPGVTVEEYTTDDGITLRGLLARGSGPAPRPGVVFFHGNGDAARWNVEFAARLAAENLDVFVGEYRGYGGCAGSPSKPGLLADGRAALAALEAKTGAPAVLIAGRSLGTGVASALAAEGNAKAVLLISPYTSILDVAETLVTPALARFALRDNFDSVESLARCEHPVTVFHGTADRVLPYAFGKALAESLGARCKLVTLEGVGHNGILSVAGEQIAKEAARLARDARR